MEAQEQPRAAELNTRRRIGRFVQGNMCHDVAASLHTKASSTLIEDLT